MHLKRQKANTKMPIARKGTKYVARPLSGLNDSVPVVVALRDMLKLTRTAKEVKSLIRDKKVKINGKLVKDYRESIKLFNLLEAGDLYKLTILPTKRFVFEKAKSKDRLCKVIGKKSKKNKKMQINLHDGTNIIYDKKINVGDSLYLSAENKVSKTQALEKGSKVFIISGKYTGLESKVDSISDSKAKLKIKKSEETVETQLPLKNLVAL
tara:strand:- start:6906 stop:7535 length:630 start_codon:yes stop_codon:yes gene_type:complete